MELDSIECVSSIDGTDEDEIHHHNLHHKNLHHGQHQFSSSKPHNGSTDNNTNSANTISNIGGPTAIALATSVHELLESAVCTNSMYPPIHQVFHCFGHYFCLHFEAFQLGMAAVYMAFLRFTGDEMEARKYSYGLEVGANGRKLIWEGTLRSFMIVT